MTSKRTLPWQISSGSYEELNRRSYSSQPAKRQKSLPTPPSSGSLPSLSTSPARNGNRNQPIVLDSDDDLEDVTPTQSRPNIDDMVSLGYIGSFFSQPNITRANAGV